MKYLYPEGKGKALTFSYDDAQHFDRKLVSIFNKYGLKATFHLNSGTLSDGVTSEQYAPAPEDCFFIRKSEVKDLYAGHEVACHGVEHKFLPVLTKEKQLLEVLEDRKALEALTDKPVHGMSYAFGAFSPAIEEVIKSVGIKYSRAVQSTHDFWAPVNFLEWLPTCHHGDPDLFRLGESLLNIPDYYELPLMYVWGHSFEFGRSNNWDLIEKFAEQMSGHDDVWYATNGEICDYITAIRNLEFSADGTKAYNPSLIAIWCDVNGTVKEIKPGETVTVV
ncbi:MAG: polysaccharide deacetylase family protein [Lachnospiraceae bacterium]|nr:polysaccharide deacetylase family protein [Lachnospiraceae bacterium]